ncbi:MAG: GntR family transcriptional regulator [Mycoplasmatales bacterium]|nr:GntR family transcriptional regulator [Mycoplasmatales bacterium]
MSNQKINPKIQMIKYILTKIQNQEWDINKPIPSERWFAIKFGISKSLVSSALTILRINNIIYSIPSQGNYIYKDELSFLHSKTLSGEKSKVKMNTNWKISDIERTQLRRLNKIYGSNVGLFNKDYTTHEKYYYDKNGKYIERIIIIVPNELEKYSPDNSKELISKSIYSFTSFLGISLGNLATTYKLSYNIIKSSPSLKRYFKDYPDNSIIKKTYKMFMDEHKNVNLIIKIIKIVDIDVYSQIDIKKII